MKNKLFYKTKNKIKNKIKNKTIAILLVFILLATPVILSGCGSATSAASSTNSDGAATTVTIGYLPITHALPVFEEKELLDSENSGVKIKLQKFSTWTDLMDALDAGKIDGASVLIELAMSAKSKGIDLKAVALGHKNGNVLVASNAVKDGADLKGRTIAIPSTQSSHNILVNEALEKAGLTTGDVTIKELSPTEMPSSLASGAIDAYCVAEPFGAASVAKGYGHVLYESKDLWQDSVCCAFVLGGSFIEKNKDAADTIVKKYNEAGSKLDAATAESVAEKYLSQPSDVLQESLQWISFDDLTITREAYKDLTSRVVQYGISPNPPSYDDFVYSAN